MALTRGVATARCATTVRGATTPRGAADSERAITTARRVAISYIPFSLCSDGKRDASRRRAAATSGEACVLQSKGKLQSIIDEKLTAYDREQALTILKLAMMCIDQSPSLRPRMSEVVSVLEGGKKLEEISDKVATPSA
ncbi:hypothetical protein Dsin_012819 [Dipteronia sinensis]|uniref:Uncharacterized protein n=1 Tax=Dipteronia sinensis TaxID=43782 RepID=A0AAE0AK04_9ROSI|nr:hypothetical protein Dsin_012819 [Dipteronia sinensis]